MLKGIQYYNVYTIYSKYIILPTEFLVFVLTEMLARTNLPFSHAGIREPPPFLITAPAKKPSLQYYNIYTVYSTYIIHCQQSFLYLCVV